MKYSKHNKRVGDTQENRLPENEEMTQEVGTVSERDAIMHFMPRKYFLELIRSCQNTLMHISRWKDVNEGVIYNSRVEVNVGQGKYLYSPNFFQNLYSDYYGQCWSMARYASEVLWHARCPKEDGVCIKTTIRKLEQSIQAKARPVAYDLQKVKYVSPSWYTKLFRKLRNPGYANLFTSSFNDLKLLLFYKRKEFSDEKEVRLLVSSPVNGGFLQNPCWLKYSIDKSNFLSEVILDPRMEQCCVDYIKKAVSSAGWTCNGKPIPVEQSPLYKPIKSVIRIG